MSGPIASSRIPKPCAYCGMLFTDRHLTRPQLYCSRPCLYAARAATTETRQCAWCQTDFTVNVAKQPTRRFCGQSCSAKWRMSQEDYRAKALGTETRAKARQSLLEYWQQDTPQTRAARERIARLNPMGNPASRVKMTASIRASGHKPPARGGNGTGLTVPQTMLLEALGPPFTSELSVKTGAPRITGGLPTHYSIDIADPTLMVAIEIDGRSHRTTARRESDQRKDACLTLLGWTVLRFLNEEIETSLSTAVAQIRLMCTTLKSQATLPSL